MAKPTRLKIVLADDEAFITEAYKDGFENAGYELLVADNGEDALNLIKTTKPDAVLLDIAMPKMTGFDVLRGMKEDPDLKDIPVAILSNLSQAIDEKRARGLGAEDFLVKSDHSLKEVIDIIVKLATRK